MARDRAVVQAFTGDGPILVAIHDLLADLFDLLEERLPQRVESRAGVVPVSEPGPDRPPTRAIPVAEPVPDDGPSGDNEKAEPVRRPVPPPPPSRAGRGSSQKAWAAWAALTGVTVPAGASRDDIIHACQTAGVLDS